MQVKRDQLVLEAIQDAVLALCGKAIGFLWHLWVGIARHRLVLDNSKYLPMLG